MAINCKNSKQFGHLYKFLSLFGFLEEPNSTLRSQVLSGILRFIFIIFYMDFLVMSFVDFRDPELSFKTTIGYTMTVSSVLLLLLLLRHKRRQLTNLLRSLQADASLKINGNRTYLILIIILFLCPSYAFITAVLFKIQGNKMLYKFYTYGYWIEEPALRVTITYLKCVYIHFVYHTFPNLVTFLYCNCCHHCSLQLRYLNNEIKNCPPKSFTPSKQMEFLKSKRRIMDKLATFETTMSSISFLLCLAHFMSCMSSLGSFLNNLYTSHSIFEYVDVCYVMANGLASLSFIFGIAGQVPIEIETFGEVFQKKCEDRLFLGLSEGMNQINKCLFDKTGFVLTGFKVIFYHRSSVLTTFGTILTYALLVMSIHIREVPQE